MKVVIKCGSPKLVPERAHFGDAGADLRSTEDWIILPGDKALVDTGVALKIPYGYMGLVVPRSSMGKIDVGIANTVGIIDHQYRGNVLVRLKNNGTEPFIIKKEDTRIAQLIITPIEVALFEECDLNIEIWNDTERGHGGFGSTGV